MTDLSRFLDTYATQTRVFPSIICILPLIVSLAAWFPDSYKLATGLIGSIGVLAATLFLANVSRARGRNVERRLINSWGGMPTSLWLCRSNQNLDSQTKERYRCFLETHLSGWKAPTEKDEGEDVIASMKIYDTAIRWLREHTRNKGLYPLIHKENISYGFRRNALGLKWTGVALATLCVIANVLGSVLFRTNTDDFADAGLVAGTVSLLALAVWIFGVTKSWVRDAADGYARALLAACEYSDISK